MRYRVRASPHLNLREGPSQGYRIKGKIPDGTIVDSVEDGWVRVQSAEHGQGYVFAGHLESMQEPAWMAIARRELGVAEIAGATHNERIVEYHQTTSLQATTDETPWCSAYMCWVMEQAGHRSTRSAAARSWLKWGRQIDTPEPGCIVILKRGNPPAGHVGFFVRSAPGVVRLLGGNQGNRVSEMNFPVVNVLGYRMP
jgi:uncharacterized protein (TIGR02594 family)